MCSHQALGRACAPALAACLALWAGATFATVLASSTFDANDEGWQLQNDATTTPTPIYSSSGGNPGGAIEGVDLELGSTWRFVAPASFLGDLSSAYGGNLSYDILFTLNGGSTLTQFNAAYVLIGNGALTLGFVAIPYPTLGVWNHVVAPLTEIGWDVGGFGGPPATAAQMQSVLSNVTDLRIRGEFNSGPDLAFLDNVVLASVPEPATLALLGIGLAGLAASRCRKQ